MSVALGIARVDGSDVDRSFDGGVFRLFRVDLDSAGNLGEFAAHIRDHQMADTEMDGRMGWINFIRNRWHRVFLLFCLLWMRRFRNRCSLSQLISGKPGLSPPSPPRAVSGTESVWIE